MAYCAICGRQHDPGVGCVDGTAQLLNVADANARERSSKVEFKRIAKQADKWLVKVLLWAVGLVILMFVIYSFVNKAY